jgi:GNAT superfamily N-acetyltransferase
MTKVVQLPSLRVTRLESAQIDEAAGLLQQLWLQSYGKRLPQSSVRQRTTNHFKNHLTRRSGNCWLAWMGNRLAGLSTTVSNCVDDVWVRQDLRRKGIGTRLIGVACGDLAQRGFRAAQAGCEDFNAAAQAMFESSGWRRVGSEPVEIAPGVQHLALVYARSLHLEEAS